MGEAVKVDPARSRVDGQEALVGEALFCPSSLAREIERDLVRAECRIGELEARLAAVSFSGPDRKESE